MNRNACCFVACYQEDKGITSDIVVLECFASVNAIGRRGLLFTDAGGLNQACYSTRQRHWQVLHTCKSLPIKSLVFPDKALKRFLSSNSLK